MFTGLYTALITPFRDDLSVDERALRSLVDLQIDQGVDGLVPVGTTGESPTVTHEENIEIIRMVIDQAAGRVPVLAGTGSNSTSEAIDMTLKAKELGASASLQVAPYYNKPNQEGLFRHFTEIADKTGLPLVIYNIPGRTGRNIEADTILRLAEHEQIVAVKEASGDFAQFMEILARRKPGFSVLSGDDNIVLPFMSLGGDGVISVASNILPKEMSRLVALCLDSRWDEARSLHFDLLPVFKTMFLDTNPIPVKYAMSLMGQCGASYRLPLCPPSEDIQQKIRELLLSRGLVAAS